VRSETLEARRKTLKEWIKHLMLSNFIHNLDGKRIKRI